MQIGAPVGVSCQGKDQFEIVQVAVRMEEAIRTTVGGCCTWLRTDCGEDSRGELGQNNVRIINDIDGG